MATKQQYPPITRPPLATSPVLVKPKSAGMRTDESGKSIRNIILLSISDFEFTLLRPHLDLVEFAHGFMLHEPGEKIEFAYFLNQGMTSLVVSTEGGRSCEIGIVGREGMVGSPLAVGLHRAPFRAITQIPGCGLRMNADLLQRMLGECPELNALLLRYVFLQGFQVAQIAACNRLHEIEQRLARWLLMCQDRVDAEVLLLTHEFLAEMLGTGRPTVSLAAGVLQRAGLIENDRGTVRILNRKSLEEAACECYGVIQNYNGGLGLK
jgi:CRP-like cAMP-binding protein